MKKKEENQFLNFMLKPYYALKLLCLDILEMRGIVLSEPFGQRNHKSGEIRRNNFTSKINHIIHTHVNIHMYIHSHI